MEIAIPAILPLYNFFERLRQNEFPLGITEYRNFLRAMQLKLGLDTIAYGLLITSIKERSLEQEANLYPKKEILSLCRLIWLKPNQSAQLFEDLFEASYLLDFGVAKKETPKGKQAKGSEPLANASQPAVPKTDRKEDVVQEAANTSGEPGIVGEEDEEYQSSVPVRIAFGENTPERELSLTRDLELEKSKFLFTQYYYPVDRRKVQQNLRAFPTFRETARMGEVDIDATIDKIIDKGYFDELVFKKVTTNTTHLLLLVDHLGSMIAFDQLSEQLRVEIKNALSPGTVPDATTLVTYYFYNVPGRFFYEDKVHTKPVPVDKALAYLKSKPGGILIFSDGGAARAGTNERRIGATRQFLNMLHNYTGKIAWLNPMPRERWENTSAASIAENAAMFEATESGIKNAVDFLKGASTKMINMV